MRHFPIFLDLRRRQVYILGAGPVADRKAEALQNCGAATRRGARFTLADLNGCALAIGADAPEADLRALSQAAQTRGIPVNIVDRPDLCSYITPSVIDREPVTVAISSGGAAPVLARLLRARIETLISPAYGRLALFAERFSSEIRRRLPDLALRRRLLERALTGDIADLVIAGDEAAAESRLAAALNDAPAAPEGMVFLVGAGPGSGDLLTLRAHRLLGEADVIVHDRLVSAEVLDLARRDAERINVGKARGDHCLPQPQINALLVRLAREGRKIVRLKGGDPLVFGRGGEEAEALHEAAVAFEIVPGVTAALACAAQARIPLTHRDAARSVTFVTGHTRDGRLDLDFAALAQLGGTLAVYMGALSITALTDGLGAHGMVPTTPAALIERGGDRRQRVLNATLETLAARAAGWGNGGPALILIGPAIGRAVR